MDKLTFLAELLKATAWPITTVVIAVLFRTEFRALLQRIRKGKIGLTEIHFAEEVKELANDVQEITITPGTGALTLRPELVSLATSNPRVALVGAWIEIETALTSLARKHGLLNDQTRRNTTALVRALANADLIPKNHVPAFMVLRGLRNDAAHDSDFNPSEEAILGYLEIAERLKQLVLDAGKER